MSNADGDLGVAVAVDADGASEEVFLLAAILLAQTSLVGHLAWSAGRPFLVDEGAEGALFTGGPGSTLGGLVSVERDLNIAALGRLVRFLRRHAVGTLRLLVWALKTCKPELLSMVSFLGSWLLTMARNLLQLKKAGHVFLRSIIMDFLDSREL